MDAVFAGLIAGLELNAGAAPEALQELQAKLKLTFPVDYVLFMTGSNGAEGSVGESYLVLWATDEIAALNEAAHVAKYAPGLVLFGSNGGDTAYAFDTRPEATGIVDVPMVGLSLQRARPRGRTFLEFLRRLAAGA